MSPISIQNRMLLTVLIGLCALFVTYAVLSIFHEDMMTFKKERDLSGYANVIARSIVLSPTYHVHLRAPLPENRFYQPRSGLGAVIFEQDKVMWSSPSISEYPVAPKRKIGDASRGLFEMGGPTQKWHKYMTFIPIEENGTDTGRVLRVFVFEDGSSSMIEARAFKDAVLAAFMCAFVLILAAQTITARWSIMPLHRMSKELQSIRSGEKERFDGTYPSELAKIGSSINELLEHEGARTETYKNSLGNLAHSLKTPLAVLKGVIDIHDEDHMREEFRKQIQKIDDIVMYQLSVASRTGSKSFTTPLLLAPIAIDIVEGLEKIHASKEALCEFEVDERLGYPASKGDLQELLGNLLENGFKWCKSRVLLTLQQEKDGVYISVEDDGGGIPDEKISVIMERGARADEHVHGHGIGLAIVADIIRSYGGTLNITQSSELSGAKFEVRLPQKE